MATIGATQLVMGFLSLTESQVDRVQPFPGAILRKVGKSQLDRSMTGVTYVLSMRQSFLLSSIQILTTKLLCKRHIGAMKQMLYTTW